jgi:hypothetical protein
VFAKLCSATGVNELDDGLGLGLGATCPAHSPVEGAGDKVGVTLLVKKVVFWSFARWKLFAKWSSYPVMLGRVIMIPLNNKFPLLFRCHVVTAEPLHTIW